MHSLPSLLRRASAFAALGTALVSASCGGDSTAAPATNPLPVLISATPTIIVAGSGTTSLTLNGSGFVRSSQARWNEADRVTHFQDDHTLKVDLLTTDVASVSTARVAVVNGLPGGGTSGVISVPVGYPAPKVTSVTPASVPIQSSSSPNVTVVITGSGFVSQSSVRYGSSVASVTSVSPTQITAVISPFFLTTPGSYPITVVNPSPGGGTSNAADFGVTYPTPTISATSPDSAFAGTAFTLTVNGTGFGTGTVVRWNGSDRKTTYVSTTRVTADLSAADATAGDASVTVANPSPGGGSSNAVTFRVREQAPVITAVNPGSIAAGGSSATLTITGTNFRSGATVQVGGQARAATLSGSTSMSATLSAADIAIPKILSVTVTNPGASGVSNAMAVAVTPASPTMSVTRTLTLTHNDIAYDATRGVLYASVPASAAQYGNSVVRIDPSSGTVLGSLAVGSDPNVLAVTDDGQYLYVGLNGTPKIIRVALATFTTDLEISIPGDGFLGAAYAEDIQPIPGAPRTIAVSTHYNGVSPRNSGAFVFDDATRRSASGPGHTGSNRITRGVTASRIYGYNNETTEFGFRSVIVAADGLHEETVKAGLVSGFGVDIEYSGGLVYATTGEVVDVGSMQKLGTIPASGVVRPDATNARVHFLNGTSIKTYHYTALTSIGSFTDASLASHTRLVRWGTDGLAAGGGSSIVFLRGSLIAP